MTTPDDEGSGRTIDADGTQREGEMATEGQRGAGPIFSPGGDQEPGGIVPPYEGRTTSMDRQKDTMKDGVRIGGALGAVDDAEFKAPLPAETPGGRTASPGDEQPAAQMPETDKDDDRVDTTAHITGVPTGESGGS